MEDMYEQLCAFPSKHKNNIVIQMSPGYSWLYIKYNFTGKKKIFQFSSISSHCMCTERKYDTFRAEYVSLGNLNQYIL